MVWPGGDLGFVQQMVRESAALPRGTVHWYTSLVGRKDSLKKVRTQLYGMGVTALRTTEFFQVAAVPFVCVLCTCVHRARRHAGRWRGAGMCLPRCLASHLLRRVEKSRATS